MAILEFQTLLDTQFSMRVPAERILECKTVGDLVAIVGDNLSD
jgi:acyl carrier protein